MTSGQGTWPTVSVVVPTHERPELLRRTVRSVLSQDYPGRIECLVVFDRETPKSPDVVVPEGREVRLLSNGRTPGPAGAMNTGALSAQGEYVAICNDDDEWFGNKLRLQVEAMERQGTAAVGICGIYLTNGRSFGRRFARIPKKDILGLDDLLRAARHEVHTSTWLVRRSTMLEKIGLVDEDIPGSYGEDYDWLVRAARFTPIVAVRRPLVWVRWQHSFFNQGWQTMVDALTYQLERRPELRREPGNLSRIYGRMAFAHAALGNGREARAWARRSMAASWRQPRAYLAYLVSYRILRPQTVLRFLHAIGRGF
jgi:glycosyltransferase involved in cell wall biosynthesis